MLKLLKNKFGKITLVLTAVVALLFVGCESQDLEFLQPYQFINKDFEEVPELPALVEAEPVVVEPKESKVVAPEVSEEFLPDLSAAETEEDVDKESQDFLLRVVDFVEAQPEEEQTAVVDLAEQLDEALIEEIIQEDAVLDETVFATAIEAAESSEIEDLFPQLALPELPAEVVNPGGRLINTSKYDLVIDVENLRTNTLVGPCAVSANSAYESAVLDLNTQRNNLIATANQNFNRRVAEANSRFAQRNQQVRNRYLANLRLIESIFLPYITAANNLQRFSPRFANQLRYYAILYLYYYRYIYEREYSFFLTYHQRLLNNEIATAGVLLGQSLNKIETDYNAGLATLDGILRTALDNCHNQGTGN